MEVEGRTSRPDPGLVEEVWCWSGLQPFSQRGVTKPSPSSSQTPVNGAGSEPIDFGDMVGEPGPSEAAPVLDEQDATEQDAQEASS